MKNLVLADTLCRNTPSESLTRKTTVEIPQNIKFFLAKVETSPKLECKYAVKSDNDQTQINHLQHSIILGLLEQSLRSRPLRKLYI